MFRMPIGYGSACGPRRGPDGQPFDAHSGRHCFKYTISFLTDPDQIRRLLPAGFELDGEAIVNVYTRYKKNVQWLGGRGYNVVNVSFPTVYHARSGPVRGSLASVVWENLAEPILTGREELGCPKIFCDIPDPMTVNGTTHCTASWEGFKFLDFTVGELRSPTEEENQAHNARMAESAGTFYYKYVPSTGDWGEADIEYAVLNPKGDPTLRVLNTWCAEGSIAFHRPTWREMPTQYMIVNALADLEIRKMLGVRIVETIGGKDLGDVRRLT